MWWLACRRGDFRFQWAPERCPLTSRASHHENTFYHVADLRVDEFACHLRPFGHDDYPSTRSRELSWAHDSSCGYILCRLALSGVLVANAFADISADLVQMAIVGGQHFLCAGSFCFCYWMSMTTPNYFSGVADGRTPEFIAMTQVSHSCWSGSARLVGR